MRSRNFLAIFVMSFTLTSLPVLGQEKTKTDPPAKTDAAKGETPKVDAAKTDTKKSGEKPADKKTDSKSTDPAAKKSEEKTESKTSTKPDATKEGKSASKEDKKTTDEIKYAKSSVPSKAGQLLQEVLNQGDFPAPKQPEFPQRARDELYQKMIQDGYSYAKRLDVNVRIFRDRYNKKKVAELNVQEVAISHVVNVMLGRLAEALILRKEPAGEDLMIHFRQNASIIGVVAKEIADTPGFPKDKIKLQLEKMHKSIEKIKPKLEKMVDAKQYYPVEQEIIGILDNLEYLLVWVPTERSKFSGFGTLRQKYRSFMIEYEKGEVKKRIVEGMNNIKPDGFELDKEILKQAGALRSGSTTTWREKTVTGPQLIEAVRDEWLLAQPRIMKQQGFAFCLRDGGNAEPSIEHASANNYDKYVVELVKALTVIIDTDAVDCKGEEVAPLYLSYLQSVAGLQAQLANPGAAFKIEEALDKLAAKDEKFGIQVKAYKAITQPLLVWRMNLTNEQVAAQNEDMPLIGPVVKTAFREDKKMQGFARTNDINYLGVIDPILPTLRRRSGRLLNRSVTCLSVVTNPAFPDHMLALLDDSCFGVIAAPKNMAVLKKEIDFLKSDLLVDDKSPPLSLSAALAIWKAENGYWAAVGTEVRYFAAEPMHALVFAVPDDEIFFTPLGKMPSFGRMGQLIFRFDYGEPYWLRHDYFYCDLGLE